MSADLTWDPAAAAAFYGIAELARVTRPGHAGRHILAVLEVA